MTPLRCAPAGQADDLARCVAWHRDSRVAQIESTACYFGLVATEGVLRSPFNCAVSRRKPQGHLSVFESNRCEPYRVHFLNCLGLPPNCPFFALAAFLAGVLANPPTSPPRRPSSAAAFD